jgi:glycosyltransferase involved in cell wall biosynthesis
LRAAFWSASNDGSSMYRCDLPAMALAWLGHTTWSSQILPATRKASSDVVVGARVAQPGALTVWKELRDAGKRLVLDLDDDYLHIDPTNKQAHKFWADPDMQARLLTAVHMSDRVTVVSEALAEIMRDHHPDVRVVPNGLHAGLLNHQRDYRPDTLVVGWAGTTSTLPGLGMVSRPMTRITAYTPPPSTGTSRVVAATLGVDPEHATAAGLPEGTKSTGWVPHGQPYLARIAAFDVLLAPYPDTPFNTAKFPTKALESGILGIPLIASAIRPYTEWVTHGVDGYLVRHDHEWSRYLKALVDDPDRRQRMGAAARARASRNVLQDIALSWQDALTFPEVPS